ncbi:serine hydrolase domain-containing protein [Paenibacillus riograndensis]|uniref:Beta-lactamase n=3 Tax=Paenibacillus riograndensis TaxID=483937 RepID=A0A0E4H9Z1_9BACL|nr:serine hydrolase [Paenibacillus riograndensis]CQR55485.1 beta-lactamase [Paenibacillus riograndensis SBR5]
MENLITRPLPRSLPEAQGISSAAISAFLKHMEKQRLGLHSFMLLRHGAVVAEAWWSPYRPELPHSLYSLSKSFTSTAIGLAVAEGLLTVEDKVVSFFPEDAPADISPNLANMNISHLLMMGTGHTEDTTSFMENSEDGNWVKAFLQLPVGKTPGTHFLYNTGATYMLSAILQKVSGLTLLEYLEPRLFAPLGIHNPAWTSCPRGINKGGYGLSVTTEDIAAFGQLYLQQGVWNNRQLLPKEWVAAAASKQIDNNDGSPGASSSDWSKGYGYQFWRCRHNAYRGDGAFGQFCIVMPEQDAVIAITSGGSDMQSILNGVWDILLPGMSMEPEAVESDPAAHAELAQLLAHLSIQPVQLQKASTLEETLNGKVYRLKDHPQQLASLALSFTATEAVLTLQGRYGEQTVKLGRGEWAESSAKILDHKNNLIMSSFTWTDENKLKMTLLLVETPFCLTFEVSVREDSIVLKQQFNVSMSAEDLEAEFIGRLA